MSKILIFTNEYSLDNMASLRARVEEVWGNGGAASPFPRKETPVCRCIFTPGKPAELLPTESCEEEGVYLLSDNSISPSKVEEVTRQCEAGEVLVLHHSSTREDIVTGFQNLSARKNPLVTVRKGQHEEDAAKFYFSIYSILTGNGDDQFNRIRRVLLPMDSKVIQDAAIRFFDGCMEPNNQEEGFVKAYELLLGDEGIGEDVRSFYENSYKGMSFKQYIGELGRVSEKVMSVLIGRMTAKRGL